MATLKHFLREGSPRVLPVHKAIVLLGSGADCDVRLGETGVRPRHAQLVFDGRDFLLEELAPEAPIAINGKKKRRTRLVHGDQLELGGARLGFSMFAEGLGRAQQEPEGNAAREGGGLAAVRELYAFSERLLGKGSLQELLDGLLDAVVELTHADKGLLFLQEESPEAGTPPSTPTPSRPGPALRAARGVRGDLQGAARDAISDSVVQEVLRTGHPIIISDALADPRFGSRESVLALRLSSVMCAPLKLQGSVMGAIYLGNDHVKHLFERGQLEVLAVFAAQASLLLQNALLMQALRSDNEKLAAELGDKRFGEILGTCPSMQEVFRKVQRVAGTDVSVLVTGETGTGKELIAREIHRRSARASRPFVAINCGAIPEGLIESELFGHVRGAFTGAVGSREGCFQAAHGGTLFLDEVGELPASVQVKLLRVLQERTVTRVGESRAEPVDLRVVAATHRDLGAAVRGGTFREDLYYRLNVITLGLPPLRERGDDVLLLARALLSRFASELHSEVRGFSPAALAAIRRHPWPGNIRQLENKLRRALVLCEHTLLGPEDLDLESEPVQALLPLEKAKEEFQRRYVLEALERNQGNRAQTARDLGVDPRTIFRYLERESSAGGSAEDSAAPRESSPESTPSR